MPPKGTAKSNNSVLGQGQSKSLLSGKRKKEILKADKAKKEERRLKNEEEERLERDSRYAASRQQQSSSSSSPSSLPPSSLVAAFDDVHTGTTGTTNQELSGAPPQCLSCAGSHTRRSTARLQNGGRSSLLRGFLRENGAPLPLCQVVLSKRRRRRRRRRKRRGRTPRT